MLICVDRKVPPPPERSAAASTHTKLGTCYYGNDEIQTAAQELSVGGSHHEFHNNESKIFLNQTP